MSYQIITPKLNMRKLLRGNTLILLLLFMASLKVHASETWVYYESFDFSESIEENGWAIEDSGDQNLIAETSAAAKNLGDRGLHLKSTPNGVVDLTLNLNVPYHISLGIDFQVFNVQNSVGIRILISSDDNFIHLDYGASISGWETGSQIYNLVSEFPQGSWVGLNRNFQDDINEALNDPNSPVSNFIPTKLVNIFIFQDGDGDTQREVYLDELKVIAGTDYYEGVTHTIYYSQVDYRVTTVTESSAENGFSFLGWFLFIVTAIAFFVKIHDKDKTRIESRSVSGIEPRLTNQASVALKCSSCGSVNELGAIFCGNCGQMF
ncbi:MAG: hypothetical protein HeimC2_44930 [Candidatus Heimdallarchaeota archaeon LC_2]|nr:MAG: hypothetical protein HeimC2_44930 [Candidatus Heimdallarchaeota archaeon LC_2]